ncbi:recombinase family protein [Pseudofrankia sp. DC12]|uniref:recombinase family protein n=1 Tax=Pseudofrankia sp. DC12 TaxID=683315 RepID=UPI0005F7824A|nr:recombinase family protein [Pseudofrankia sp. DC12]
MTDLSPTKPPPVTPAEPADPPTWWRRLRHRRADRDARLLAAHHAWTTDRARHAQIALVRAGYHLGPVPYGYQALHDLPTHSGTRRHIRLATNPRTACVVAQIYRWRVEDNLTDRSIMTRLRGIADLALIPIDPTTGLPRPWTLAAVSRVLANPVYTGATVWGRTRHGQPVPPDQWTIHPGAHEPIIDGHTFHQAQLLAPGGHGVFSPLLPPWKFPSTTTPTEQRPVQ